VLTHHVRKHLAATAVSIWILALTLTFGLATEVRAQGFISPFIGYDFGGDASCPNITNCQDKKLNAVLRLDRSAASWASKRSSGTPRTSSATRRHFRRAC